MPCSTTTRRSTTPGTPWSLPAPPRSYGAHVANRVAAIGFLRQGERVTGIRALDKLTDREFEVNAKQIVNATGVWTDDTQAMVGERGQFHVRASKGIHLVVPRDRIHSSTGLILRTEKSVLFVIPWGRHWIIGTTDTDWALDKAHPAATPADIDYLLDHVNRVLATPLTHEDVEGVYAGLRPLLAGESESTSKLSREHVVAHPSPGLVVVAGGKYTTYRVMAKDAVDEAAQAIPGRIAESTTETIPLLGGVGYQAAWNQRADPRSRPRACTSPGSSTCCGATARSPRSSSTSSRSTPSSGPPATGAEDHLRAEVVYAASHEGALHLDRRPDPAHPHLHRGLGPWGVGCPGRRRARRADPRLGRGPHPAGDRHLPRAGRGRAGQPDDARRRLGRRGPPQRAGRHALTPSFDVVASLHDRPPAPHLGHTLNIAGQRVTVDHSGSS